MIRAEFSVPGKRVRGLIGVTLHAQFQRAIGARVESDVQDIAMNVYRFVIVLDGRESMFSKGACLNQDVAGLAGVEVHQPQRRMIGRDLFNKRGDIRRDTGPSLQGIEIADRTV